MKMIITLTGHKHCGKEYIAEKFGMNADARVVTPYTDKPVTSDVEQSSYFDYHFVSRDKLDKMIENGSVLCSTIINGNRYVFFEWQLIVPYNVLIVDDYQLVDLQSNWKGKIYTIKVISKNQVESDRIGEYYYNHEFDEVFDYDMDSYDELEARISYGFR